MRHCYIESIGVIPAIADLTMVDEKTWELNRINVPMQSRGVGHGSRLLRRVLDEADAEDVTIVLSVFPSGPLDDDALTEWYQRNGFGFMQEQDEHRSNWQMIRHPNPYCGLCDGAHQPRHCPSMPRIREAEAGVA